MCIECFGAEHSMYLTLSHSAPLALPVLTHHRVTRVEPKIYLANERTFLNWLNMSVNIGSVASALAGN